MFIKMSTLEKTKDVLVKEEPREEFDSPRDQDISFDLEMELDDNLLENLDKDEQIKKLKLLHDNTKVKCEVTISNLRKEEMKNEEILIQKRQEIARLNEVIQRLKDQINTQKNNGVKVAATSIKAEPIDFEGENGDNLEFILPDVPEEQQEIQNFPNVAKLEENGLERNNNNPLLPEIKKEPTDS